MKLLSLLTILYLAMPNNVVAEPKELIHVKAIVTGYSSEVEQTDDTPFITASGERVKWLGIACPRKYSFGTIVLGLGDPMVCNDRMAYKNDWGDVEKFDIWFPEKKSALEFGKQKADLYIINF
jgi:3D (Asp-Asp-Asp) domain-containing protein